MTQRNITTVAITLLLVVGVAAIPVGFAGMAVDTAAAQSAATGYVNPDGSAIAVDPATPDDTFKLDTGAPLAAYYDLTDAQSVTVNGSTPGVELNVSAIADGQNVHFVVNGVTATVEQYKGATQPDGTTTVPLEGGTHSVKLDVSDAALQGEPIPNVSDLSIADGGNNTSVVAGTQGDVTVNVTNNGTTDANSYDVNLSISNGGTDQVLQKTTNTLAAGESQTLTFQDPISGLSAGDYTLTVSDTQGFSTVSGNLQVEAQNGSVTFDDQATNSSTITDTRTDAGVTLTDVWANLDSSVVVTYQNASGDTIIAASGTVNATTSNDTTQYLNLSLADMDGFPGEYTARVIPQSALPNPAPGAEINQSTKDAAVVNDTATVYEGAVSFTNQTFVHEAKSGDLQVNASLDNGTKNAKYRVALYETNETGAPTNLVGQTDNVTGEVTGAKLTLDNPITATGDYVAVIHVNGTPLPNVDSTNGAVYGGVSDRGTVQIVSLTFTPFATNSSTVTSENRTDPAVWLRDVDATEDSAVIVTYSESGTEIVAASRNLSASDLPKKHLVLPLEDTGGLPGNHTAYLIPQSELSNEYAAGDNLSKAAADAAYVHMKTTVSQGTVEFHNQTFVNNTSEVTVDTASLAPTHDYTIAIRDGNHNVIGESGPVNGTKTAFNVSLDQEINLTSVTDANYVARLHYYYGPGSTHPVPNIDAATGNPGNQFVDDSASIEVLTPPNATLSDLTISGESTPATIVSGEDAMVNATLSNVGEADGEFNVSLDIGNGTATDNQTLTVNGSANTTVSFAGVTDGLDPGEYNVTLNTTDETIEGNLTVLEPAASELSNLSIAGQGNSSEIVQGEDKGVTVDVTNVGADGGNFTIAKDTFDVSLDIGNGTVTASNQTATLAGNESDTVRFDGITGGLSAGDYNVTISTDGKTLKGTLTVLERAESNLSALDIAGQGNSSEIVHGDNTSVSVDVTNSGNTTGNVSVTLSVGGVQQTNRTNLAPSEKKQVTFQNVTGGLDTGNYLVSVSTGGDTISGDLAVLEKPAANLSALDIAHQNEDANILVGDNLSVNATLTNDGENDGAFDVAQGTFDVTLDVGDNTTTKQFTVDGSAAEPISFPNATGNLSAGDYNVTVSTDGEEIEGTLSVLNQTTSNITNLDIAGQGDDATIVGGHDKNVSFDVTNTGDVDGGIHYQLAIGEGYLDQDVVSVNASSTKTIQLPGVTGNLGPGEYTVTVTTTDDTITGNLTVLEPAASDLSNLSIAGQGNSSEIVQGEDKGVTVNLTNVGTDGGQFDVAQATFDLTLHVGDETMTKQVTVDGSATEPVAFENVTGDLSAGDYPVTLSTADGSSITGDLTVLKPAASELGTLDVAGQGADATITEGNANGVAVKVTNVGEVDGDFTLTLDIGDGTVTKTNTVSLTGGEAQTVTFSKVTGGLSPGDYTVTVETGDATTEGSLTVKAKSTSSSASSSTGGGGGGSTGGGPAPGMVSKTLPVSGTNAQIQITGASGLMSVGFGSQTSLQASVSVQELASSPHPAPEGKTFVAGADITFQSGNPDNVGMVQMTVSQSQLDDLGVAPEQLALYHYDTQTASWVQLDTSVASSDDTSVTLEAPAAGFSPYAVFASQQAETTTTTTQQPTTTTTTTTTTTAAPTTTTTTTSTTTAATTTTTSTPGMGLIVSLLGMVLAFALLVWRRREDVGK